MRNQYDLQDDAIERMEGRLRREIQRRNVARARLWWLPQTPFRVAFALAAVVVVSMGVGGGIVAAAYQAQQNEQREQLASVYEQRVQLAVQRLDLARTALEAVERRVEIGVARREDTWEERVRVAEAEAALARSRADVEEVRLSGREPRDEVSAPLVSGRDFVTRRLDAALLAPPVRLDVENRRISYLRMLVDVGRARPVEIEVARAAMGEAEAAITALRRKQEIRLSFVRGTLDVKRAELQALEVDAEMRRSLVLPKIEAARQQSASLRARVDVGLSLPVELAEATLRLRELEAEQAKAELDLAVIRRQLQ